MRHHEQSLLGSFILMLIGIGSYAVKLALAFFLTRIMSKAMYGDFSVAISLFSLVSSLLLLGTNVASNRFLSIYLSENDQERAANYFHWNIRLVIKSILVFFVLLIILLLVIVALHVFNINPITNYHLAIYFLFFTPLGAFSGLILAYILSNKNKYLYSFFALLAQNFLIFGFFIPAALFFSVTLDNITLTLMMLAVFVVLTAIEFLTLMIKLPATVRSRFFRLSSANHQSVNNQKDREDWLQVSRRLILNQVLFLLIYSLDLYIVEIFGRTEAMVAHYVIVIALTGIILKISNSVNQMVVPHLSNYFKSGQFKKVQSGLNLSVSVSLFFMCTYLVMVILFAKNMINFLGPHYANFQSETSLIILSVAFIIAALSSSPMNILIYSGHENKLMMASVAELLIMVILGIALTLFFGIIGMSVALLCGIVTRFFIFLFYSKKIEPAIKPLIIV